jgi:hypothetical protein
MGGDESLLANAAVQIRKQRLPSGGRLQQGHTQRVETSLNLGGGS